MSSEITYNDAFSSADIIYVEQYNRRYENAYEQMRDGEFNVNCIYSTDILPECRCDLHRKSRLLDLGESRQESSTRISLDCHGQDPTESSQSCWLWWTCAVPKAAMCWICWCSYYLIFKFFKIFFNLYIYFLIQNF